MYISHEDSAATNMRLSAVLAAAKLQWFEGPYAFFEYPIADGLPTKKHANALALVRDD